MRMSAKPAMSFSLYVHIPYCQAKCPYCDFNSHAASSWPERAYTDSLMRELSFRAAQAPWRGQSIDTIFFGGGTPSLFAPASIGLLLETASRLFGIAAGAEITLEANPGTVDEAKLYGLRSAGINRMSFGAQSFDDRILKFLGRIHSAEETREAARAVHRAGFERFNLDLMFAVPGQTIESVIRDIDQAAALGPDHISDYNLTFEEGTAFFAEMQRGRITPLESDEQAAMYAAVRSRLPALGYKMYEISNYANPGHESRHNLNYWRARSYLGIGAGAHSFARQDLGLQAGGRRWWNERAPAAYIARAASLGNAESGAETIDEPTAAGEFVFLNLRLREGFALCDFRKRFGKSFASLFGARSARLFDGGLLTSRDARVFLSDRGLELADSIFAEFV
jgi:oxygen-independent coproporphyrinogen-3 oxidase